jgi:hypothetical protein
MGVATTCDVIAFSCGECGRKIRCPASYAGKAARCPGCKKAVRAPGQAATLETRPKLEPKPAPATVEAARSRHATRVSRQIDNTQLVGGLLAMAGATVWFVIGLQANVIFLYPPLLFLGGLGTVIKVYAGGSSQE